MGLQTLKNPWIIFLIVIASFSLTGCIFINYGTHDLLDVNNNPDYRTEKLKVLTDDSNCTFAKDVIPSISADTTSYKVLVLTDVHFGAASYNLGGAVEKLEAYLNSLNENDTENTPAFCIAMGDFADHGYDGEYKSYNELVEKIEAKKRNNVSIKVINAVGNHDLFNSGWYCWQNYCWPNTSFYKFAINGISYYVLDTGSGVLGDNQMALLEKAFATDSNPKIIITHYALYSKQSLCFGMRDTKERNALIKLLAENNVIGYLCGHYHSYEELNIGSAFTMYSLSSFGEHAKYSLMTVNQSSKTISVTEY